MMSNNSKFTIFSVKDADVTGCKADVNYFKTLTDKKHGAYSASNLKKAYKEMTGVVSKANINFYVSNGFIVLVPETGKGFDADWNIIKSNIL